MRSESTTGERLAGAVRPLDHYVIDVRQGAKADMDTAIARRQIAAVGARSPPQRRLTGALDADACARHRPLAIRAPQIELDPVSIRCWLTSGRARLIQSTTAGPLFVVTTDVNVAVVVDVAECHAASNQEPVEERSSCRD